MKSDTIQFGSFAVPLKEFATQGNAILGIRDSGKSYTATFLAERLLDYGIPFVAFDPIGVWRCLKVPGSPGLTGYKWGGCRSAAHTRFGAVPTACSAWSASSAYSTLRFRTGPVYVIGPEH
jgi:hypothetical protein